MAESQFMEAQFIKWLENRLSSHADTRVGIGDDAAVLCTNDVRELIVTTDAVTDGVDFHLEQSDPTRIGRKALAVNLSDLAAMAADPMAAVVSLVLPREGGLALAHQLYEGILPLAEQFNIAIVGGDTNSWEGGLVISITAFGKASDRGVWLRSNAKPGDEIIVTGEFGGSILGKHFDFTPRIDEARTLNAGYQIHAAIDVSDGLSLDLNHIAQQSNCGAVLDVASIPISDAALELARQHDGDALEHALSDGEDFELILVVPSDEAKRLIDQQPLDVPLTRIGYFIDEPGLWQTTAGSDPVRLAPAGFQHLLDS